ncbi:MAG TPA: helix-turn-helix transcriptional regulator [Polyangiaceae bacterium]|jgi:transcriptional regulator with XRE-family HTH domain
MAPRRKRITPLGEHLRRAREALGYDQAELAARTYVSARTVSRWENGQRPDEQQTQQIASALRGTPGAHYRAVLEALGLPPEEDEEEEQAEVIASANGVPPAAPQPAAPTAADYRAALDALLLAESETRDVLPRHLRGFAVALLHAVARLGLGAGAAAELIGRKSE